MSGAWRGPARVIESRALGATGPGPGGGGRYHVLVLEAEAVAGPARPGQFVHVLCPGPPGGGPDVPLLRRPFSLHDVDRGRARFELLFELKGPGTRGLACLAPGDELDVMGPLGRGFPAPEDAHPVIVGGGVGLAPLLFLARTLAGRGPVTVLAGLRTGEDLPLVEAFRDLAGPLELRVATEDGTEGTTRGRVTDLFAEFFREYASSSGRGDAGLRRRPPVVYACGPRPMLAALWRAASPTGCRIWVSLEERMACGVGACRGCAVAVKGPAAGAQGDGGRGRAAGRYRLVCRDGPVFDAAEVDWGSPAAEAAAPASAPRCQVAGGVSGERVPDLSVVVAGIRMKNPVMTASGTFGYGREYSDFVDLRALGAIVVKGVSLEPWEGNPPPRTVETRGGLLNSIGLENPGLERFLAEELPSLAGFGVPVIVNVVGRTPEEYAEVARRLGSAPGVAGLEANISCPNVEAGGLAFGTDPDRAADLVAGMRRATELPLIVKLSPNVADVAVLARSVVRAGADAVSLINTLVGLAIDPEARRPVFARGTGGLSGPAVKPVALAAVYRVAAAVRVPVIGLGGIMTGRDAVEFLMAGASAVAVGTAAFIDPGAPVRVAGEIADFMVTHGYGRVTDLVGLANPGFRAIRGTGELKP